MRSRGLAGLERRRDVDLDESPDRFDGLSQLAPGGRVGRDGRANRDAAVSRDLGRDETDAAQVDLPVLVGEAELAREVLAHDVSVEERDLPLPVLAQHRDERMRERGLAGAGKPGEQDHEALPVARRVRRGAARPQPPGK